MALSAIALSEDMEPSSNTVNGQLGGTPLTLAMLCQWVHTHLPLRAPPPEMCMQSDCRCEDEPALLEMAAYAGSAATGGAHGANSCAHVLGGVLGGCLGSLGKYCARSCGRCVEGYVLETTRKKKRLPSSFCNDRHRPPWAWFTVDGSPISTLPTAPASMFVLEVGTWVHAPVSVGHVTPSSALRTLSVAPPILVADKPLLSSAESDQLIALAEPRLQESLVEDYSSGPANGAVWRTGAVAWLTPEDGTAVQRVYELACQVLQVHRNQLEKLQIVRYLPGEYYKQHTDFFEYWKYPEGSDAKRDILKRTQHGSANRVATLLWYLSDSGSTNFPRSGASPELPVDWAECGSRGVTVQARRGAAVLFYSMMPNGTLDGRALHAGCQTGHNETKWIANLWLWNVDISAFDKAKIDLAQVLAAGEPALEL